MLEAVEYLAGDLRWQWLEPDWLCLHSNDFKVIADVNAYADAQARSDARACLMAKSLPKTGLSEDTHREAGELQLT
jgi:hypothetical protein